MGSKHYSSLTIFLLLLCVLPACAQVPVVDAGESDTSQSDSSSSPASANPGAGGQGGSNQLLLNLYTQLEQLQREVQNLRGMVEEQAYRIRRMEQQQQDRYMDLDRRLRTLTTGGQGNGTPAGGDRSTAGTGQDPFTQLPGGQSARNTADPGGAGGGTGTAPGGGNVPRNQQDLYRTALNMLLEESDYERSISLFQRYIDMYPEGRYITNAYYWQGEALILVSRYSQARDAFMQVIERFPNDTKAAGALLKLGVVHERMGDIQRARETWESIRERYPDSLTEIRAAEDYLNQLESPNAG